MILSNNRNTTATEKMIYLTVFCYYFFKRFKSEKKIGNRIFHKVHF